MFMPGSWIYILGDIRGTFNHEMKALRQTVNAINALDHKQEGYRLDDIETRLHKYSVFNFKYGNTKM